MVKRNKRGFLQLTVKDYKTISKRNGVIVFFLFLILFGVLFLQFPINDSLPGNNTTWFILSQFNFYYNKVVGLFGSGSTGSFFYPASSPIGWADTGFLQFPFYFLAKAIGINELYSYYFYMVMIFTLTAFSLYYLANIYLNNKFYSLISSLVFTCSNFTFGNIEDIPLLFFFFVFFSIYFLKKSFVEKKINFFFLSAFLSGIQAHCFSYSYLLLHFILIILFILNWKAITQKPFGLKAIFGYAIIDLSIASTFFLPYIIKMNSSEFVNPFNNKANATIHSFMEFKDFFRKIPGNIYNRSGDLDNLLVIQDYAKDIKKMNLNEYIFPVVSSKEISQFLPPIHKKHLNSIVLYPQIRKSGFLGFSVLLLSILGFLRFKRKTKLELGAFAILGVFLCLGPFIYINGHSYRAPLFWFYEYIPFFDFFRVPSRAFLLCVFSFSIFSAKGAFELSLYLKSKKIKIISFLVICSLLMIENIPYPFSRYKYFPPIDKKIMQHLKGKKNKTILYLPSSLGLYIFNDSNDVFAYARDYIYMNWKTFHNQNIINGMSAYLPSHRIKVQTLINSLPKKEAVKDLMNRYHLNYIIYVKNFIDKDFEKDILNGLKENSNLKLIETSKDVSLFEAIY